MNVGESAGEGFLHSREPYGMRFGLERMRLLLAGLGNPQDGFDAVHVVGTNGKSTTTLMTGAALRAQGLRVGCFNSPRLVSFRDHVDLGGSPIEPEPFEAAAGAVRHVVEQMDEGAEPDDRVTQFEAVTAVAFTALRDAAVDAAVIEAGLGGRLDATNTLGRSRVQVLTGVGIDHTEYLGDTIEQIAGEKLAVVRSGAALVCGPLGPAAAAVANRVSDERDAAMTLLRVEDPAFAGMPGEFVRRNASLALDAAQTAFGRIRPGAAFLRDAAAGAIVEFVRSGRLPGRLQIANVTPLEVRDVAHNQPAAAALAAALPELVGDRPVTLLLALMADKCRDDLLATLLGVLPEEGGAVVCTQASTARSLAADELAARIGALGPAGLRVESVADPLAALGRAREIAGAAGAVVVTGSNFLLSDLLRDGPDSPTRGAGTPGRPGGNL